MDTLAVFLAIVTCGTLRKRTVRGDTSLLALAILFALTAANQRIYGVDRNLWSAVLDATLFLSFYLVTIVVITVVYRLSPLHPLSRFPGPLLYKVTGLKLAHTASTGKRHLIIADLHKKYGIFVRTGPNILSINSRTAVHCIYTTAQCMDKSDAYRMGRLDAGGLFFLRDLRKHNERRRIWSRAFTSAALDSASRILDRRTRELVSCIRRRQNNGVVDLGRCIQHWSYDVMGDLTFGGSNRMELMQDDDKAKLVEGGQKASALFDILGNVPPLFDILSYLQFLGDLDSLQILSSRLLDTRKRVRPQDASPDICSHLLFEDSSSQADQLNIRQLNQDTLFAIQAGSDTTSGVLTFTLFYIISDNKVYGRLSQELKGCFPTGEITFSDHSRLLQLPYLSAVVTEGLRLGSPFRAFPRVVPGGGTIIDNTFVAGGTIVGVPVWAQHISSENFWPKPEQFIPERWLDGGLGPGSIARKSAIMSFSSGPFGCLGKALALKEVHVAVAQLLLSFDLQFSAGFDHRKFQEGIQNTLSSTFAHPLTVNATLCDAAISALST
ncbi:cytochrome P450 [Heliocybe sulcata]|uniref:Cytochrome P450 n=1 Tax=Heliocybe sulcata TaxID=5364 RepID=A0A5C3N823_9AGAM|nr:cytochrome P450 [Heliocybe sulcata]